MFGLKPACSGEQASNAWMHDKLKRINNMPSSPKHNEVHLKKVVSVWRTLRPAKKFLGLTVDEFEAELKPALDARNAVNEAEARLTGAINARNEADNKALAVADRFINAVKADATEGENSEVLEAIGYVIPIKRKSGLQRKSNTVTLPKAA